MPELLPPDTMPPMRPYAAAKAFQLPEGWQNGRGEEIVALAMDPVGTLDADDVITFWGTPSGEGTLYVGHAESSLLRKEPVLCETAVKRKFSTYSPDGRAARPMFPRPISEGTLSLRGDGQPRPVFGARIPVDSGGIAGPVQYSFDIVRPVQLSYEQADAILARVDNSPETVVMRGLQSAVQHLRAARRPWRKFGPTTQVQNEEGTFIGTREKIGDARFIVSEAKITLNGFMGGWLRQNNVPTLYRNCFLAGIKLADLEDLRSIPPNLLQASWSTESFGHVALNLADYTKFGPGLRHIVPFTTMANIAALRAGEPFPYPTDQLESIAKRLNRVHRTARTQARQNGERARVRRMRSIGSTDMREQIANGEADENDLLAAIFYGEGETGATNARAAMEYITHNAIVSNSVVVRAVERGLLTFRPATPKDPGDASMVAEFGGKIYPYTPSNLKVLAFHANTRLLGAISGLSAEESRPVAAYLKRPTGFLISLRTNGHLVYHAECRQTGNDEYTFNASVYINGRLHTAAVTMDTTTKAERAAAAELVERLDLFINPPTTYLSDEEFERVWGELAGQDTPLPKKKRT